MNEKSKRSGSALHRVGDCLIVSINSGSDEDGITATEKTILNRLSRDRARGVIIDLSDVAILTTNEFSILKNLAESISMMGTVPVFSGFQPGVAASLVDFDTSVDDMITARNTDDAFEFLTKHAFN